MAVHPEPALPFDVTVPVGASGITTSPSRAAALDRHGGVRVDHFLIERKLGSGGMGAIYAARDVALDRPVAIKILPDEVALRAEAQDRFIREAQAQARLSSPHVVSIFFIGRAPPITDAGTPSDPGVRIEPAPSGPVARSGPESRDGSLYFAMELVEGGSLEAPLDRGEKLAPEEARRLMIQVAKGLRDAFRAGIIHRDIKPGNLLVDRDGHLKIADFGLAKPSDPNLALTREGAVMGTPYYMAPEQALGEALDLRADMYALGCTFYHLLTGAPPFDGPNPVAVIAKHLKEAPKPIRERAPEVPERLAVILDRLMSKEPADRFPDYDELLAALDAAAPTRIEYAGFWARTASVALDALLASVLIGLLGWPGLVLHIAYLTLGHAYFGQTLAKYVLRIQVQRLDGSRLGLARSLGRTLAAMWLPFWVGFLTLWTQGLSGVEGRIVELSRLEGARALIVPIIVGNAVLALLYGAGMALAAVHKQKRALHDLLMGSHVVYRLEGAASPAAPPTLRASTPSAPGVASRPD